MRSSGSFECYTFYSDRANHRRCAELPDTGGPSPGAPLAVVAALVLLVSGLAVARLVRGHGAAS
jgi:hypothetical protein